MNREYHRWWSPALERDMELLVFGHEGVRVIVFPTATGRFYEWEDHCMISTLSEPLEQGRLQLFCVDSIDNESWYNDSAPPGYRAWRHVQYEQYLLQEVIPLTWQSNQTPFLMATGAEFGAYYAINSILRYPQIFQRAVGMSGLYDVAALVDGYHDDNVYFNNPLAFVGDMEDPHLLRQFQHAELILTAGREDPLFEQSRALSEKLWNQGIWHAFHIYDGEADDWSSWREMARYIGGED